MPLVVSFAGVAPFFFLPFFLPAILLPKPSSVESPPLTSFLTPPIISSKSCFVTSPVALCFVALVDFVVVFGPAILGNCIDPLPFDAKSNPVAEPLTAAVLAAPEPASNDDKSACCGIEIVISPLGEILTFCC